MKKYRLLALIAAVFCVVALTTTANKEKPEFLATFYTRHVNEVVRLEPYQTGRRGWGHRYGHGSGVVISAQGHILTAAHVARLSPVFLVTLADGRTYKAGPLSISHNADVAVLQPLGEAPRIRVWAAVGTTLHAGDQVIALGCPLNMDWVMTVGVVSSLYEDQTVSDVTICFGSSGGPLYNRKGEVVGIASALLSVLEVLPVPSGYTKFVKPEDIARLVRGWKESL